MDTTTIAAVAAAIAAIGSAWWAFRSAQSARRTGQLAEEQYARLLPSVELYMINGDILRVREHGERVFRFRLRLTNRSDAPTSIAETLLRIELSRTTGPISRIEVQHAPSLFATVAATTLPLRLPEHDVVEMDASFPVQDDVFASARIHAYFVVVVDTHGERFELRPIILREVENEDTHLPER